MTVPVTQALASITHAYSQLRTIPAKNRPQRQRTIINYSLRQELYQPSLHLSL